MNPNTPPVPVSADSLVTRFQLKPEQPVHFVGVGGIGMSALARLLLEAGYTVSGSDMAANNQTQWLSHNGATIYTQHQAQNVPAHAAVVLSTAIGPDNPERAIAAQRAQVMAHRSDVLREILQGKALHHQTVIGVSGTHGKTTITGMMGQLLMHANLSPTIVAGGVLPSLGSNACWDKHRRIAVAELDESDGSIVQYSPTHLLISNLELDHADHYPGGFAQILRTFETVLARMPVGASVVYNLDCSATCQVVKDAGKHLKTVSVSLKDPTADVFAHQPKVMPGAGLQARVILAQQPAGLLTVRVPGLHNLHNALMCVAVAQRLNIALPLAAEGLAQFTGMGRRFETIRMVNGALLIDDYGHHPTEVIATLSAAKDLAIERNGKVMVVFQPHRYSRLQALWAEFTTAFDQADRVWITDVYGAGEAPLPGVDAPSLAQAVNGQYLPKADWINASQTLLAQAAEGDVLISMGAGDITRLWRQLP
jgi:UDP-N-acetylmuramate--alanine ligase